MKAIFLERTTEEEFHDFFVESYNAIIKKRNRKQSKIKKMKSNA